MHYYKRNIGDYAKKAGRLSMLQHGSYTLLIDACYDREQFPTMDDAIEWTWASTTEEIEAVRFVLRKFFVLEGVVYVQKRIEEEIAEFHDKSETNRRIAIERETKRKEVGTIRKKGDTVRAPDVHEPPPNQEPITNNHKEPIKPMSPETGDAMACPVGTLINLYHEAMPNNPQVKVLNAARKATIRQRWREAGALTCEPFGYGTTADGIEAWRQFFAVCAESKFLTGRAPAAAGKPPFVANIDFIFNASNFAKILENNYHRSAAA